MLPVIPSIGLIQYATRRLRVETVSDFASFLALKQAWDGLVSQAALDHPFVTHEWIRAWWESFAGTRTMHIIVVREGDNVVGIAPMLEDTERFYGFKLRKLTFIWNTHVPRCDFIVAGQRLDVYRTLWEYIAAEGRRWDLLLLPQLPEGSPTLTWFKELAVACGFLAHTWSADASPYVPISGTWEEYFESLPCCFREGLQRYDFLGKEEEWKSRWSRRVLSHHWMFIYPNNPRTALFNAMKFRLAPMIQELGQVQGRAAMTGLKLSEAQR